MGVRFYGLRIGVAVASICTTVALAGVAYADTASGDGSSTSQQTASTVDVSGDQASVTVDQSATSQAGGQTSTTSTSQNTGGSTITDGTGSNPATYATNSAIISPLSSITAPSQPASDPA